MWELDDYRVKARSRYRDSQVEETHHLSEKLKGVSHWGKKDILTVSGIALSLAGLGIAAWVSYTGLTMLVAGILLAGVALNERLISWTAIGALGIYLTVTAIVLLFQIVANASDIGVNWLEQLSWFFRVVGVTVSLPILWVLWYLATECREVYKEMPQERLPSYLPATAVSVLLSRDEDLRTPFTLVLQMQQQGKLVMSSDESSPPLHRLTAGPGRMNDWEQSVIDSLPEEATTQFSLLKHLNEPELGLRQQIREYLRHSGLLRDESAVKTRNSWFAAFAVLGAVLLSVGLALWIVRLGPAWYTGLAMIGVIHLAVTWSSFRHWERLNELTVAGRAEVRKWKGFGTHLLEHPLAESDTEELGDLGYLMPYSVAILWRRFPRVEVSEEPPQDLISAIAESWRQNKVATVIGFGAGVYIGSRLYPGDGVVEGLFNFSELSATLGGFDTFGAGDDFGGDFDGDLGGDLGDVGGDLGGGIDISF